MLISLMSFFLKFKFWLELILSVRGEYQVMLTHSHNYELFIPICEEVKKIYKDHSHHPKIPLYGIIIPIYITQQYEVTVFHRDGLWMLSKALLKLMKLTASGT